MTLSALPSPNPRPRRLTALPVLGATALLLLSGCVSGRAFDWDLRGGANSAATSEAALAASDPRPNADARGVISYPGYQVALAQSGDSVTTVANRVGIAPDELARYNALRPADTLRPGEVLALPTRVAAANTPLGTGPVDVSAIATTALDRVGSQPRVIGSTSQPIATAQPQTLRAEPVRHQVQRGETAFSIARTYGVAARSLADWNGLGTDLEVREGQYLIIPTSSAPPSKPVVVETIPGAGSPTPLPPSAKDPLPAEKPVKAAAATKPAVIADLGKDRTAASSSKFAMPVQGKIIRSYVKKKNDGIDISAPAGSAVKSAADGVVAAITKDTKGTPIVVIRHADGILTVYAGVDGLKVAKGDSVKRGQTIAAVRASDAPFVHFEVRRGVDSLDPMGYVQ
ncbi:MAG: peptidoglycan DD-metalloendopeptidase family protein [Cypionkella sp.]